MDSFITFLFDHEYPFTLILAYLSVINLVKKKKIAYPVIAAFFLLVEVYWHYRPLEDVFSYLLIFLAMLAMSFFILKEKIFVSLAFVTFTFTLQHLSYKITSSIVYAADPDLATSGYYFLIYVPIFLLVDGLFFTFAYLKKKKGFSFQVNSYLALALSLVMVISNIVVSYYS